MLHLLAITVADVAAGVLLVAGIAKLGDPTPFTRAVVTLGVPARRVRSLRPTARLVGAAELATVVAVVALDGLAPRVVLLAWYVGFTVVSVALARTGADCGCFGVRSTPVGAQHVIVNAAFAVATAASLAAGSLAARLDGGTGETVAYVAFAALGTTVAVAVMTLLAEVRQAVAR